MTIEYTPIKQGYALKHSKLEAAGVCLEACRRWVKQVITGSWRAGESVYDIFDPDGMAELLATHGKSKTLADKEMEGYTNSVTARTGGGPFSKFQGLRTRLDVINTVLIVPGAYIYSATAKNAGGHAFGFNSLSGSLAVFDPNQGEWIFKGEDDAAIRGWWSDFWDGNAKSTGINYKNAFHKGDRELWRFEAQKWAEKRK